MLFMREIDGTWAFGRRRRRGMEAMERAEEEC